jgi:hypothetical protein
VRALQSGQSRVVSPKGMALVALCIKTFGLAISRPLLWPCILIDDWCRLMTAIATTFSDDKAQQAIECSTWLLERLDQSYDTELSGLAIFSPLQVAMRNALQKNLTCAERCGKIGCATTSLLARFFLVFDKVKGRIVEKFCRADVERMWKTNCILIAKQKDALQVCFPFLVSLFSSFVAILNLIIEIRFCSF